MLDVSENLKINVLKCFEGSPKCSSCPDITHLVRRTPTYTSNFFLIARTNFEVCSVDNRLD